MPHVTKLAIAPVKGLALLPVDSIRLASHGAVDNRRFFLLGPDGEHRSGLAIGPLATIVPHYDSAADWLTLRFPDGRTVEGDARADGELLTVRWGHGRRVAGRPVEGLFSAAISDHVGQPLRLFRADVGTEPQTFAVSVISEESLETLARSAALAAPLDDRRFRMLVTVAGCEPFGEDEWLYREIAIGDAVVRVEHRTPRCATTTRDPATGLRDWDALRALKDLRGVSPDKSIDFGVYATVVTPGAVAIGDQVRVMAREGHGERVGV